MTNTIATSKTDQVKEAIMAALNSTESANRKELHDICSTISSARTITRALASLKLDGRIQQIKDGKGFLWISMETPVEKKADLKPETKIDEQVKATDQGKQFLKDQGLKIVPDPKAEKKENEKETKADPKKDTPKKADPKPATKKETKIDPKDGKFFGYDSTDTLIGAFLTKKEANTFLAEYTKEIGADVRLITLAQLTDIQATKIGIKAPATITKGNLVKAGKTGVKRNPAPGKTTPPAKEKKFTQTSLIRDGIKTKKTAEKIYETMIKNFGKDLKWAKARFATYEKAYGKMGINDPALKK